MNILLIFILLCFVVSPAWAEEKIKIQEVVVTASKIEQALEDTTSDVTIVRGEDIAKMNVSLLPDVLRRLSFLDVVQSGGDGKVTSVFLRGGDPKQTLVMIDGVKVNSPTTGGFDFSGISVEDIERIEIVKGAQSTIYGSEAGAGVIHIITRKGEGRPRLAASFEAGSFGTYSPTVSLSGSEKTFSYRVSGSYFSTDGISAAKDGSEKDGYKNGTLSWKFGYKPAEIFELDLVGRYYADRSELDGFDFATGRAADAPSFVQYGNHFLLALVGKLYLMDKWEQVLTLSTFRDSLKFRDPDSDFNNADILNKRQVVDWQNNLYLSNALTLTAGLQYQVESGDNTGNFEESLDSRAVYVNSIVKLLKDALVLNAGLRYDDLETAGSKTTYRVGASYTVRGIGLTLKASYGTGFRAPSLNDLFFPFFGNPSLKPEESKSFDAGLIQTFFQDRLSLAVAYFNQKYENLIQADPRTFTAINIANASVKGVEANGSLRLFDGLEIRVGYTYLDTEDEDTGLPLIRRPKNKFSFGIGYAARNLSLLADYVYVGGRFDSTLDAKTGNKLPPYSLVNLSGTYTIYKNIALFARVDNLFNKDYEDIRSFGTKGSSIYGGIKVTL